MSSYAAEGTQDVEVRGDPAPAAAAGEPAPGGAAPQDSAPGDVTPHDPVSENAVSDDAVSGAGGSEGSAPVDGGSEDGPDQNDEASGPDVRDGASDDSDGASDDSDGDGVQDYADASDDDYYYYYDEYYDETPYERPKLSKLAVVALITGVIPLVPIALITGIAALIGIRRSGRRGQGMAISALLFAVGWVVVAGGLGAIAHYTHLLHKQVKVSYVTREASVFKLQEGDCVDSTNDLQVTVVSCTSPHDAEVFGTFSLAPGPWPGTQAIQQESSNGCASRLTGYINPQLAISLTQTYIYPTQFDWTTGTRTVVCEVRAVTGQLSQSVRGAS